MKDYLMIGCTPCNEDCALVGQVGFQLQARREMTAFIHQLRREFGDEVGSVRLAIKWFPHDFGTYGEVVCYYDNEDEVGADLAFRFENNSPREWDDEARKELGI